MPSFKILVQSQLSIVLREVDSLNSEQVRILSTASDSVPGGPFGTQTKISLPQLKTLDSAVARRDAASLLVRFWWRHDDLARGCGRAGQCSEPRGEVIPTARFEFFLPTVCRFPAWRS